MINSTNYHYYKPVSNFLLFLYLWFVNVEEYLFLYIMESYAK